MSRLFVLPLLSLILLGAACTVTNTGSFKKRTDQVESFTLVTLGEPEQHFTAKLNLDGREREFSGTSPAKIPLEACVLTGTIRKNHGEGTLRFRVVSPSSTLTFGNLTDPGQSFRFRYHARGVEIWN